MSLSMLAILISTASVAVAGLALGWNIYRDVLLRARFKIRYQVMRVAGGAMDKQDVVFLAATNMGPSRAMLRMIHFSNTTFKEWLTRKKKHGFITCDFTNPDSWKIPCWVEVGETAQFFFPVRKETDWVKNTLRIGLLDSFDRFHWCKRKDAAEVRRKFEKLRPDSGG